MAEHSHQQHQHGTGGRHHDEAALADVLDLDAEAFGSYLDEVTEWVHQHAAQAPRTVADVGAGTGAGTLALARRFAAAEVIAIDQSAVMLDRLRAAALGQGLDDRVRVVQADLDVAWPQIGAIDLAWASSSLHHVADPDRLIREVYAAMNRGGLLVVVEMDALPRFLPDDIGLGWPGLETRCHEAAAQANWNAHPNWQPHLERAGFEIAAQRSFTIEVNPAPPSTGRYAHAYLSRIRSALDDRLTADDLHTLDRVLADDAPEALLSRRDLTVRGSRTAWAARRP
jgi:SAM-dependent methyltransferase